MASRDFGFGNGIVTETICPLELFFIKLSGVKLIIFFLVGIFLKASSNSLIILFALSEEELVPIRIPISCFSPRLADAAKLCPAAFV